MYIPIITTKIYCLISSEADNMFYSLPFWIQWIYYENVTEILIFFKFIFLLSQPNLNIYNRIILKNDSYYYINEKLYIFTYSHPLEKWKTYVRWLKEFCLSFAPFQPIVQWEHGRGLKLSTNPGLVMTTGAIKAIFDIPSLARAIEEKPICSFAGKMVVFPQFLSSDVEIRKSPRWPP